MKEIDLIIRNSKYCVIWNYLSWFDKRKKMFYSEYFYYKDFIYNVREEIGRMHTL